MNVICIIVPSAYFILASLDAYVTYTKELTIFKFHALNLNLPYSKILKTSKIVIGISPDSSNIEPNDTK